MLIPTVGRRHWRARLLITGLYIALSLGGLTMVYPFLIMLSTSVKSNVDVNQYGVIPRYLHDDNVLFAKYVELKYAGDMQIINDYYKTDFIGIEHILSPQESELSAQQAAIVRDWREFGDSLPAEYKQANYGPIIYAPSRLLDEYRNYLRVRFDEDIEALNEYYREENNTFGQVFAPHERTTSRSWQPDDSPKMQEYLSFVKTLPSDFIRIVGIDALFADFLRADIYEGNLEALNAAYGTNYGLFNEIHLSPTLPQNPGEQADWEEFVRHWLPFRYMEVDEGAAPSFQRHLAVRYDSDISEFNRLYGKSYTSFQQIMLPEDPPKEGAPLTDWMEFIADVAPVQFIRAVNAENVFRKRAIAKYGDLDAINETYGLRLADISELSPPYHLADWEYLLENRRETRRHFLTRNHAMVLDYIILHGRAVFNTFIFVTLAILTHLIVNPLCAYALSRYNLRYAYKVLLFLLATMAFPAEVAMIPNFLLLKQLGMLNTFYALVLPGMASGYAIFLLKGFFDSLPKELYEAGIIDGASELTMFRRITIPLSKPIFAVIALQAFTASYGAFMFAFLVCQDPKMWTMMVWLYQLQITAPQYITMAALSVAAVPTLLVFVFCQNIIMRGIIIPSFK